MEQSEEVEEEIESSEEASSEEDNMDTYALHQQREMMAMQTRLLSMPYAPPAPALQCWPQPPPYYPGYSPYPYPGCYPQYPPMQMMPPQPPMRKPLKKTRLAQPEQEAMAEFGKLKKKQKGR